MDLKCIMFMIYSLCFGANLVESLFFGANSQEVKYNTVPGAGYQPPATVSYLKAGKPNSYQQIEPQYASNNYPPRPIPTPDLGYRARPGAESDSQGPNPPHKPTALYINFPFPEGGQQYPNAPTYNLPPKSVVEPPSKNGFWNFFSFITWPKWLSSKTEGQTGHQYDSSPSSGSLVFSRQPAAPSLNGYRSKLPLPPYQAPTHQQGLYQVPAPNSKYPFIPQAIKYPSSGYQPLYSSKQPNETSQQYLTSQNPYASVSQVPTTRYPTEITKQTPTIPKSPVTRQPPYDSLRWPPYTPSQPAYSIYLVPSKPVYPPQDSNNQHNIPVQFAPPQVDPSLSIRPPYHQRNAGFQGSVSYRHPLEVYSGYVYQTGNRPPVHNIPTLDQQHSLQLPSILPLPPNSFNRNDQVTPKPDCEHTNKTQILPESTQLRTVNDDTKVLVIETTTLNSTESLANTTEVFLSSTSSSTTTTSTTNVVPTIEMSESTV